MDIKAIIILGVIGVLAYLLFQVLSNKNISVIQTTSIAPSLEAEIKKQDSKKLNLTYISTFGGFYVAKYNNYTEWGNSQKFFVSNSTATVTCNQDNNCSLGGDDFKNFFKFNASFVGVRSSRFGLCKLFEFYGSVRTLDNQDATGKGSTCILENGFPYNYSLGRMWFTLQKVSNFSTPRPFVIINAYGYYNQSSNITSGVLTVYPFSQITNATYNVSLGLNSASGKINSDKGSGTDIKFSLRGFPYEIRVKLLNHVIRTKLSYYTVGCPSSCPFGCIPGTSACYYPQTIPLQNGDFSEGFKGWNVTGNGFFICNSSCYAPFGGKWSGYLQTNFATTCKGKTTAFGNITSNAFTAYLPFLNFQLVSYPVDSILISILSENGSILREYQIDTTKVFVNDTRFANVSIPIAQYWGSKISFKVSQLQSGLFDYVRCVAVGNLYQSQSPIISDGVVIKDLYYTGGGSR